ncbi:membrane protease YdiL (CAAX protease family) [Streptococcus rupicaprae]|uniref:Membrane protease YdiL (CAAX protease family) n=2 Tax=Streptococcus rupicaprae TaxID=759619 RepID=A0ABV2FJZ1_9STRE
MLQIELGSGFSLLQTLMLASLILATCWGAIVYAHFKGWLSLSFQWVRPQHLKLLLLSYPLVYGASFLGAMVMQLQGVTEMANQETLEGLFTQIPVFLTFMLAGVAAPIIEEILCRAAVPELLFPRYPRLGLLIGSLFFAWLHVPGHLGAWIIYGGMGLVFAWLRYKTGRLEMAIAGHMLWNSVALMLSLSIMP